MELKELNNKEVWENFLQNCTDKTFLQSWSWGEVNLAMGNKIWRFAAYSNGRVAAIAMAIRVLAKRGTFLFIPHGPVVDGNLSARDKKEILLLIVLSLSERAEREKASFIRISPLLFENEQNKRIFYDLGFRESPMHSSAYEATWRLDLNPSEEQLLKDMRKTTRYLIKKTSENIDIEIVKSSEPEDILAYQELTGEVSKRQRFVPFSDGLIKNEFEAFSKYNQALFIFGKYKGEIAAGALIIFWQGVAFYHQAASIGKFSKFSIPYLLQWEAIREAKRRGCSVYDFWGFTDPRKFPSHPWAGPSLFKMGFGGFKTEYVKTQDFIISNKYWINYIIEKLRKLKRHL